MIKNLNTQELLFHIDQFIQSSELLSLSPNFCRTFLLPRLTALEKGWLRLLTQLFTPGGIAGGTVIFGTPDANFRSLVTIFTFPIHVFPSNVSAKDRKKSSGVNLSSAPLCKIISKVNTCVNSLPNTLNYF